ncbi:MAG: hypothetical protein GX810_04025, partial [Clostridiales bacterium]|nr:hypothetical protein [Clostridiales bacterium]
MKKLLTMLLAVALVFGLMPGIANATVTDTLTIEQAKDFTFTDISLMEDAFTITNKSPHTVNLTIEVYAQADRVVVETINLAIDAGAAPVTVQARVYKMLVNNGDLHTYTYRIRSANVYCKNLHIVQKLVMTKDNEITYNKYI